MKPTPPAPATRWFAVRIPIISIRSLNLPRAAGNSDGLSRNGTLAPESSFKWTGRIPSVKRAVTIETQADLRNGLPHRG
jgi:hypothetical protein